MGKQLESKVLIEIKAELGQLKKLEIHLVEFV
jgi:hypothetical protein